MRGGGIICHKGTRDNKEIDVYKCSFCGTKFLSSIQNYDYENGFMNQTDHMSQQEIEARLLSCQEDDVRRFNMLKELCREKSVLDFGCGFGGFLKYITPVASEVLGVELGRDERNYMKEQRIPCVKNIEEQNSKWDVITLFHCFEHLSEPEMWLEKFSEYLKPGGKLIIEVPHANDALLEIYQNKVFADYTYWSAHLYLYTIKSLRMLIEETNKFEIESAEQIQRYPLSNHLMWLAEGKPGGHKKWSFMNSVALNQAYEEKLRELEACDTLFFMLRKL